MLTLMIATLTAALAWTPPKDIEAAKKKLTGMSREVTQNEGTEPPFRNAFHDNHADGLYVDVVTGEPLFDSKDKYDSGTGWPSFTKPIAPVVERRDKDGGRTEVRSKLANSHLGHVFDDGPAPTGKRYCMNSAAMRFIPRDKLVAEGYGEYVTKNKTAVFAGGCFWSMQKAFDALPGVTTRAGFSGGRTQNPTYEQVSHGKTGHRESVEVTYDPAKTTYAQLLETYWSNTDPYDGKGQFCDKGEEYMPAVFYANDEQKQAAEKTKKQDYKTALLPAAPFYPAEEYHQHYAKKNPERYEAYRIGCGRDKRLSEIRARP